jgi:succinate dehydrogenase / fumarate reductase, cytochrome b subunit
VTRQSRPLSPFIGIYKWRYTVLNPSILHRACGIALSLGLILLSYFLWSVASGADSYKRAVATLGSPWFCVVYIALIWTFCFHALAGIRHLVMDAGFGLERSSKRASTIGLFVFSALIAFALCWWLAFRISNH